MLYVVKYTNSSRFPNLVNRIYETDTWQEDLGKTILVPIQRKSNGKKCAEFRTVDFICHLKKKTIQSFIWQSREENRGKLLQ